MNYGLYIIEGHYSKEYLLSNFNHELNILGEDVIFTGDDFKVEDAEILQNWHIRSVDEKRVAIIAVNNFNIQSQNKLLKIFEEPNENTHFFIFTKNKNNLLKTILSRGYLLKVEENKDDEENIKKAKDFVESSIEERLAIVEKLAKDYKDEKITKEEVERFGKEIVNFLKERFLENKRDNQNLKKIIKLVDYIRYPGSSIKIIFQAIAFLAKIE